MALPSRTTPGLPNAIKPLGIHTSEYGTRRKIVMANGVPYYQSSGRSNTPGFGHKESGSWWPFSGIEPQGSKWADHLPNDWFMKGPGFGEHPEGAPAHAMDWSMNKPNQMNDTLQSYNEHLDNHDWHEFEDEHGGSKQLNDSLTANGWDVPMRGEYQKPETQAEQWARLDAEDKAAGAGETPSLQSQGSDFQNGVAMNLAWRLLKRQTELGEHHEDFPSSHGPVTGYRAVSNEQREKMIREGMVIKPSAKRPWGHGVWAWMGHNKEGLDDAKFNAEHWADQANYTGKPSSVVGIRGKQDLSHPDSEMHNYNGEYPWKDDEDASHGPYALPNDIPPEQTVRVVNRHPSSASDWAEKWGRQNE